MPSSAFGSCPVDYQARFGWLDMILSFSRLEYAKTTDDSLSGLDLPLILEVSEQKKTEKTQKF